MLYLDIQKLRLRNVKMKYGKHLKYINIQNIHKCVTQNDSFDNQLTVFYILFI
jgi:hypothetical protein